MKLDKTAVFALFLSGLALISGCSTNSEIEEESTTLDNTTSESSPVVTPDENSSRVESADGSSIFYDSRGEGDVTLVFVHCWTCNSEFWQPQIDYFARDYRVVWLDLAGHGKSSSQRQEYTMSAFGNDVAAVVDRVGADRVVLVGHSMGGPVVIEAAKLLGDRVIGIVGVDTFYTPFEFDTSEEKIQAFVQPFKEDFKGASEQLVQSMFTPKADPEVVSSILEKMGSVDREMAVSALYEIFRWRADSEPSDLPKYAEKLHNINGAFTGEENPLHESVVLIPEVGHFVAQVKPDEFNRALEEILAEYSGN